MMGAVCACVWGDCTRVCDGWVMVRCVRARVRCVRVGVLVTGADARMLSPALIETNLPTLLVFLILPTVSLLRF